MQFVESTRRPDCGPQASEPGAEDDDIFHGRTLPTYVSLISRAKPRKREWRGCRRATGPSSPTPADLIE
jgi:hypothetical protein